MQVKLNELRLLTFFVAIAYLVAIVLDQIDYIFYDNAVVGIISFSTAILVIANCIFMAQNANNDDD